MTRTPGQLTDREAERVIAEWQGLHLWVPPPGSAVDSNTPAMIVLPDGRLDEFSPSTDANLWFGEDGIFAAWEGGFESARLKLGPRLIKEQFLEGPRYWTHALAAAILEDREMKKAPDD